MSKKNKKKYLIRYAYETLFDADVVLVISKWEDFLAAAKECCNTEKYTALQEMVEKHGHDAHTLATQFPFDGGGSIIWANEKARLSTLVHEVVHAAHYLLKSRATPLSSDTEETYAYLTERLFGALVVPHKKK